MLFLPGASFEYASSYYGRLKAWAEEATYLKRYSLYDIPGKSEKGEHMRLVHVDTAMQ
jgi:hypothetical protein